MSKAYIEAPAADSMSVFREDIFKGKVLFCTGGGSGICKGMTLAIVSPISHICPRDVSEK